MGRPIRKFSLHYLTRRSLFAIGFFAFLYPLLRFIGFHVPAKPERIAIDKQLIPGQFLLYPRFILFVQENKAWAVARKCTHLGCMLHYREKEDFLECPCHQSRFSKEGQVLNGPASKPLKIYPVEKRDKAPFYVITL
jgi:nitrite reductase/ring-hydroxylating ferredoxin subunit